jgi:hypothetical protein
MESEKKKSNSKESQNSKSGSFGVGVKFAVCIQGTGFDMLAHKVYRVLHDREAENFGCLRVIDESGEDYMYPASWFILVKTDKEAENRLAAALSSSPPPDRPVVNIPGGNSFLKDSPTSSGRRAIHRRVKRLARAAKRPIRKA